MKKSSIALALFVAVSLFAVCLWWFGHAPDLFQGSYEKAQQAGEMFGVVSTFFTGLGFAGLTFTILQQQQQLSHSRQASEETRKTGEQERFENTFFQLLTLFNGVVNGLRLHSPADHFDTRSVVEGREAISVLYIRLEETISSSVWAQWEFAQAANGQSRNRATFLSVQYQSWYFRHEYLIAHYFRVLYRLLRHVQTGSVGNEYSYAKVVRAQLSGQEVALLFCNSIVAKNCKMKWLVEKYGLLKHIPDDFLADQVDRNLFSRGAYLDAFQGRNNLWGSKVG